MSTTETGNGPIKTHPDGAVRVKVWRNETRDEGKPFYSVTIGRVYRDQETGEWRESRSLSPEDVLKSQPLLGEAYQTIRQEQALDREHARTQTQEAEPGLSAQRDAAMANAPEPQRSVRQEPDRESRRHYSRQPEQ